MSGQIGCTSNHNTSLGCSKSTQMFNTPSLSRKVVFSSFMKLKKSFYLVNRGKNSLVLSAVMSNNEPFIRWWPLLR